MALDWPFKYHVYIAFYPEDEETVHEMFKQMQDRELSCCHRYLKLEREKQVPDLIRTSQKCLVFLSPAYLDDSHYHYEIGLVLDKVKRFGNDTVIVMKSEPSLEVPVDLQGFKAADFVREQLSDKDENDRLAELITTEPKLKFSYGPAAGYFFGYLRLILPDFRERLFEEALGKEPSWKPKTLKKMLIIIPESCSCCNNMEIPGKIEFTSKYALHAENIAGHIKRDYKTSLYKVICTGEEYYFAGEFATPLFTLYETFKSNFCDMTLYDLYDERDLFYHTLKAILNHADNVKLKNQFKLVVWRDPTSEKPNRLDLHQFLLSVIRKELELERNSGNENACALKRKLSTSTSLDKKRFRGCNPARMYDKIEEYPMNKSRHGMCLIINIINFPKGSGLEYREGAKHDSEVLKSLFDDLKFDVDVRTDVDLVTLQKLLLSVNTVDHSKYDAFACCILSHGSVGDIYTSDGKPMSILHIADHFADQKCPKLKGKPKMFFIQACLLGLVNNEEPQNESSCSQGTIPPENGPDKTHKHVLVPGSPDFLMSYATLPGATALRDTLKGSYYINALNTCLRSDVEITTALMNVTNMVNDNLKKLNKTQWPFYLSTLGRQIYL